MDVAAVVALDAPEAAPLLLNRLLVHGDVVGRITEVEAYMPDDPASHTFGGPTRRNAMMYQEAGRLYVYFIYGRYHCANVVTGPVGSGQAVLVRAVEPVAGMATMLERRGRKPLADGPGKLCQAFGIDSAHNGVNLLADGPLGLADSGTAPPDEPLVGPRVGLSKGIDTPWRFRVPPKS